MGDLREKLTLKHLPLDLIPRYKVYDAISVNPYRHHEPC